MIIQLNPTITEKEKSRIKEEVVKRKYKITDVTTQQGEYLIGIGKEKFDIRKIGFLPGISDIHIVSDDFKLVSSKWKVSQTTIDFGDGIKMEVLNPPAILWQETSRSL